MQAKTNRRPVRDTPSTMPLDTDRLRECINALMLDAAAFISPTKVDDTMRGWLMRGGPATAQPDGDTRLVAEALGMATDLALFTPSASGQTAFDRLARQRPGMGRDEAAALQALRKAEFRLLRIEAGGDARTGCLRDLVTGDMLPVLDDAIGPELAGVALVGRLAPLGDGRHVFVSGMTPLDEAGLAVASSFVRPGRRGLVNPHRCAGAVYRHALRHGTPSIPGLNRPPEGWDSDGPEEASELDQVALRWATPGGVRDPEDVQLVRTQSDLDAVLDMLASAANTRTHGEHALPDAYAAIVRVQLKTLHPRHAAGPGTLGLDAVAAAVEAEVAGGTLSACLGMLR